MLNKKLTLKDSSYNKGPGYISIPDGVLLKNNYFHLFKDEQIVKKAILNKEEAEWFEKNKLLNFADGDNNYLNKAKIFIKKMSISNKEYDSNKSYKNLIKAYFTDYIIKQEKKYYIKLRINATYFDYLYFYPDSNELRFFDGEQRPGAKNQFTQEELDKLQTHPHAKGLIFNDLKVEVPTNELV